MKSKTFSNFYTAIFIFMISVSSVNASFAAAPARQFYQIIIYHLKDKAQEQGIDKYLADAYLPAVHRLGIKTVGIFKNIGIDTAADKRVYILLTFQSLKQFHEVNQSLNEDKELSAKGSAYINAPYNDAPFIRKESILMEAFSGMPILKKPVFTNVKSERVYELRSYESPTEKLHLNKVQMFNNEEVEIFDRIGSQALFYAQVIAGSRMPNLMYMTSYTDKKSRDEHWDTFFADPKWKKASASPEYQHNVSKSDIQFLFPTEYSDL